MEIEFECEGCASVWKTDLDIQNEFIGVLVSCPLCKKKEEEEAEEEKPKRHYKKKKLKSVAKKREKNKSQRKTKYTEEMLDWLRDHINKFSNDELLEKFNDKFELKINYNQLCYMMAYKKIKREKHEKSFPKPVSIERKETINSYKKEVKKKVNSEPENKKETRVNCPYCHNSHINKVGFSRKGTQRYYCIDCKKKFIDDRKNIPEEVRQFIYDQFDRSTFELSKRIRQKFSIGLSEKIINKVKREKPLNLDLKAMNKGIDVGEDEDNEDAIEEALEGVG